MMALVVVACVIVMTFMLVALIYFKCYKVSSPFLHLILFPHTHTHAYLRKWQLRKYTERFG
jgi:uncharacterized membrane protein YbaN (DUF454 family)